MTLENLMNSVALAVAAIVYSFCMCILNSISMKSRLKYKQEIRRTFVIPAISAVCMGTVAYLVYKGMEWFMILIGILEKDTMNWLVNCICLIPTFLIAVVIYFALIIKLRAVSQKELEAIPKGRIVVKIASKMRLL